MISVSGVPILQQGRQHSDDGDSDTAVSKGLSDDVLDRIKNLTYLEPKGKSAAQPSVVEKGPVSSSAMTSLLFGFPRDVVALTADDREVTFTTKTGPAGGKDQIQPQRHVVPQGAGTVATRFYKALTAKE